MARRESNAPHPLRLRLRGLQGGLGGPGLELGGGPVRSGREGTDGPAFRHGERRSRQFSQFGGDAHRAMSRDHGRGGRGESPALAFAVGQGGDGGREQVGAEGHHSEMPRYLSEGRSQTLHRVLDGNSKNARVAEGRGGHPPDGADGVEFQDQFEVPHHDFDVGLLLLGGHHRVVFAHQSRKHRTEIQRTQHDQRRPVRVGGAAQPALHRGALLSASGNHANDLGAKPNHRVGLRLRPGEYAQPLLRLSHHLLLHTHANRVGERRTLPHRGFLHPRHLLESGLGLFEEHSHRFRGVRQRSGLRHQGIAFLHDLFADYGIGICPNVVHDLPPEFRVRIRRFGRGDVGQCGEERHRYG
mmetsp:Transcript_28373/g.58089  ORF Transcript_28373/g.58089 Transcript_28373/m.58089 type:complete len:356 (+) Transcript_28373:882-1949(+)